MRVWAFSGRGFLHLVLELKHRTDEVSQLLELPGNFCPGTHGWVDGENQLASKCSL